MRNRKKIWFGVFFSLLIAAVFVSRWQVERLPMADALDSPPLTEAATVRKLAPTKNGTPAKADLGAGSKTQPLAQSSPSPFKPLSPKEILEARSEMKMSLAAPYGAQKAFYAEHRRYSTDLLNGVGFLPDAEKQRWSKVGFLSPYSPEKTIGAEDPRYFDIDEYSKDQETPVTFTYRQTGQGFSLADLSRYCEHRCTANDQQFEIMAAAILVEGNAPDIWIINEKKVIRHARDGLVKDGVEAK